MSVESNHKEEYAVQFWGYALTNVAVEKQQTIPGGDDGEATPVPIPNTVVKLSGAENTWLATAWENRELPGQKKEAKRKFCFFLLSEEIREKNEEKRRKIAVAIFFYM